MRLPGIGVDYRYSFFLSKMVSSSSQTVALLERRRSAFCFFLKGPLKRLGWNGRTAKKFKKIAHASISYFYVGIQNTGFQLQHNFDESFFPEKHGAISLCGSEQLLLLSGSIDLKPVLIV
jgi:hypothetical protein